MAAAYSTGVSTSPTNLLQTFVTWLVAQGWTLDSSVLDGAGWRAHLHKGSIYVNLRAAETEQIYPDGGGKFHDSGNKSDLGGSALAKGWGIGGYLGTGYSGASAWDAQAGGPVRPVDGTTIGVGMNLPSGAVAAYHFFDDGADNVTLVVERSAGVVTHLGFGPALAASGQPEDFWYFFGASSSYQNTNPGPYSANRPGINVTGYAPFSPGDDDEDSLQLHFPAYARVHTNGLVRVDAASYAPRWIGNGEEPEYAWGYTGKFLRCCLNQCPTAQGELDEDKFPGYQYLQGRTYQTSFAGALLLPLYLYMNNAAGRWTPIGYPPTVFWSEAVGNGYSVGDVYQVGGDDYMVFPNFAVRKAA